jgi:hypothetical protein
MMFLMRDYSKGPFFIWAFALIMFAIRSRGLKEAITWTATGGFVVGVGVGFRADAILLFPVGLMLLAIGGDYALLPFRSRVLGIAVFALIFVGSASPMLAYGGNGRFGSFVMQGATDPFVRLLEVRPGPYDLGWAYSDELTLSGVAADLRPLDSNWDINEPAPSRGVSQSLQRSTTYLFSWAGDFVADFATHCLKAAGWIAGFPALLAPNRRILDPGGAWIPDVWFGKLLLPGYLLLARPILPLIGGVGLLCFVLLIFAQSPREALGVTITLAILMMYPAIEFSMRHVFHLELLFWLGIVSLARFPFHLGEAKRAALRFAFWLGSVGAFVAITYAALLWYQDRVLLQRVADLVAEPRESVDISQSTTADGTTLIEIPLPDRYMGLTSGPSDAETPAIALINNPWRVQAAADRLILTVGGAECPPGVFSLGFVYKSKPDVWQSFDHSMPIQAPPSADFRTLVVVSAFYRATQYLEALRLPPGRAQCISQVERVEKKGPLPAVFSAVLPPGWQNLIWHQSYGSFSFGGP